MDEAIVTLYCLCDDFLRANRHRDHPQRKMIDAEVMTAALVAALYFGGNRELARRRLDAPRYIPNMLSKSRLNRRFMPSNRDSDRASTDSRKTGNADTRPTNT